MKLKKLFCLLLAGQVIALSFTAFEGDASCVTENGYNLYVNGTALEGMK